MRQLEGDNLEELIVSGTRITGNGLKHLTKLPRLKNLRMFSPVVYDDDLAALEECHTLRHLALFNQSSEYLTDLGLANLQRTGLTEITFGHSKVTQRGVNALRAALPNSKVTFQIDGKK